MDATPGLELFESYEGDLQQVLGSVSEKIDQASAPSSEHAGAGIGRGAVEAHKAALRRAEMELEEADEIVSSIHLQEH